MLIWAEALQASDEPELQLLIRFHKMFAAKIPAGHGGQWPVKASTSMTSLLPSTITIGVQPLYVRKVWARAPVECAVGPGESRRADFCAELGMMLFTQGRHWSTCATEWTPGTQAVTTWRFQTLKQASRALCPGYGMLPFFHVKGRPAFLGEFPTMGAYEPNELSVWLAAPVAILLLPHEECRQWDQVCVIDASATTVDVVKNAVPHVIRVPKDKVKVVAPLVVSFHVQNDSGSNFKLKFKATKLDHYCFYE